MMVTIVSAAVPARWLGWLKWLIRSVDGAVACLQADPPCMMVRIVSAVVPGLRLGWLKCLTRSADGAVACPQADPP